MGKAGLLYPKLKERPREFRINPNWPYYQYLSFLCVPCASSSSFGPYWSKAGNFIPSVNGNPLVVWHSDLKRFVLLFTRDNDEGIIFPSFFSSLDLTVIMWCHPISPWSYNQQYTCFSSGTNSSDHIFLEIKAVQDSKNTYVKFQLGPGLNNSPLQSYDITFDNLYFLAGVWNRWLSSQILIVNNDSWSTLYQNSYSNKNLYIGRYFSSFQTWNGYISDLIVLQTALPLETIIQLNDQSNLDLRIGNVPLILPPQRRWWPTGLSNNIFKRRGYGFRTGSREAVYS